MVINLNEQTAPSTPSTGITTLYFKTDGTLCYKTPAGDEKIIKPSSDENIVLSSITFSGTVNVGDLVAHDGTNYLRATNTTLPIGIKTDTDEITLLGRISGLTGLIAGQPYFQDGYELTLNPESQIKIGFAISTTELLLDIDVEGDKDFAPVPMGLFAGRFDGTNRLNIIDYITISTTSNAVDFGDLTEQKNSAAACANTTRAVFAGGNTGPGSVTNVIDYITIATTGDATDFGDLTQARSDLTACSSSTRGIFAGGWIGSGTNVIDYITIATTSNATDFGDLTIARANIAACGSSTRGVFGGGYSGSNNNRMDYITIATTSNATTFGNLLLATRALAGASNSTRGVFAGGYTSAYINVIQYITIATTGNATDFGDLTVSRNSLGSCASSIRNVMGGGYTGSSDTNVLDYVEIATTGNATDFGDLTSLSRYPGGTSNSHGGLS
jgi:hypothetical protein